VPVADRVLPAARSLRLPARGRGGSGDRVRAVRTGSRHDPGPPAREPREAPLCVSLTRSVSFSHDSREGERLKYFVTGATGFIGRRLVERLLERDGTIYVLVREGSRARLEELIARWNAPPGRIVPVVGDITAPMLGVSDADAKALEDVDHFFHLAAIYD